MALTRITKGVIKPNENYDTHNINSTGIVTAIGLDVNGNGDISGNLNVGGVLTYEDVTSIDSVGIITAQSDIHVGAGVSVVGVVTATTFVGALTGTASGNPTLANGANNRIITATGANALTGEPNLTWTGAYFETNGGAETWTMRARSGGPSSKIGFQNQYLANGYTVGCGADNNSFVVYTAGQNNGERLRIDQTGISTFSQNLFASKDFDVDGHTELDNVNIVGVTTHNGQAKFYGNGGAPLIWGDTGYSGHLSFDGSNNAVIRAASGKALIFQTNHVNTRMTIGSQGNVSINNDLDVDGHTNLDNVNIAGVTTFASSIYVADSIIHQGDTDTKIQFDTNQFLFNTGGSTRLELDDTQARFTKVIKAEETGDNKGIRIHSNGGISATANVLRFNTAQINGFSFCQNSDGTSSGERFRIAGSGNVSIFKDLDVDGHTNLDNVSIAGVTTFASNVIVNGGISADTTLYVGSNLTITEKIVHDGDTDTYLQFTPNTINLHSGGTTGLTVLDSSVRVPTKLGINGAAPQVPLDVIANGSGYAINIRGRSSDNVGELRFTSNNYGSLYGTLKGGATYLNFSVDSISSVLRLNSTGLVTMDNGTAQLCMRDSGVVDNAIFYIGGGTRTQTSTTTDFTQICLYDKNSQYNTQTANGSWKSKIKFFAAQMNGGAREGAFIGQDTTYNNFSGSTIKMRSDLIFGTRGDAQTSSSDPATEKLRIRHNGQVQISEPSGTSGDGASLRFFFGNNNSTDVISSIYFANNVGEVASIRGQTRNGNNYGMITFHNDVNGVDGESMRLNHDGGFCVGTDSTRTAEFTTPDGFSVRSRDSAKGQFQVSVTNETCALLNKKGNNGQIIGFRKDGTGVGEIGVNATTMYLNFGGTSAAAHQLDDYETGTWTCTVYYATGNTTGSHTNTTTINGYFEKIGNLVFIGLNFYPVNYNSGNTAIITKFSLPYNPVQRTALAFYRYSGAGNYGQMLPQSSQDDSGCYLDTAGHGVVLVGGTNQGSGYWGHHTGQVNAHGHVSGCYRIA